jgi:hypothetical protein
LTKSQTCTPRTNEFNEVIPSYEEEYYNELNKLSFEVASDESTVDSFQHLVGESYSDDDTLLEFVTTRVVEYKGLIVAYRAPVLSNGRTGREDKSPIHVADVMRMRESSLRLLKDSTGSHAGADTVGRSSERKATTHDITLSRNSYTAIHKLTYLSPSRVQYLSATRLQCVRTMTTKQQCGKRHARHNCVMLLGYDY